jgi:predicted DNA-binding protein (UPF0251 family)/DNA-directed RNA polymerase subunit RPC12/RpoP
VPRKTINRQVKEPPLFDIFKPRGVAVQKNEFIIMNLDEFEAIRLADYLGLDHKESSLEMEISRSTFSRLITRARKKLARLIIEGKQLKIDGGQVHFRQNIYECHSCGHKFKMSIQEEVKTCPSCGSRNLFDLAGGFGHGRCCSNHSQHRGKGRGRGKRS